MADAWKLDESAVLAVREGGPVGPRPVDMWDVKAPILVGNSSDKTISTSYVVLQNLKMAKKHIATSCWIRKLANGELSQDSPKERLQYLYQYRRPSNYCSRLN